MTTHPAQVTRDWVGSFRSYALAWGLPHVVVVFGLFVSIPTRAILWSLALAWMGTACLLNAQRCRRTHCRYTGSFYSAMIAPVASIGSGIVSVGLYGWIFLGAVILIGGKIIWWATERKWGTFS